MALLSCSVAGGHSQPESAKKLTSMIRLISAPSSFEGVEVTTIGYLLFDGGEENVLYLTRDDANHGILPNGLAIDLSGSRVSKDETIGHSNRYVMIRGVFRSPPRALSEQTSGMLSEIVWIIPEDFWGRGPVVDAGE
jgi:hypothetical protein